MNNQNYPYGYEYPPYGYQPYYPPPEKTFSQKVKDIFRDGRYRGLILSGTLTGGAIIIYFILSNIFGLVIHQIPAVNKLYSDVYMFRLIAEMFYSLICVGLPFLTVLIVLRKTKVYTEPLPYEKPQGGINILLLIFAGLGICFFGNVITSLLYNYANAAGFEFRSFEQAASSPDPLPDNALTAVFMVLHTALMPALIEEFAFRGVVMQPLRRYGDWFAIIVTGIMFGLLHANMMQVPFAIIAGVALGYVAIVTGSIWTSVLLHFLNNFISLVYTGVTQILSEGRTLVVSTLTIYGLILIGIVAFIGYILENRNFYRLRPGRYPGLRKRSAVFFLMPTMVISILIMLFLTIADIKFVGMG